MADMLHDCGTDLLQGYLISRPLPLAGVIDWLRERAARPSVAVPAEPANGLRA